MKLEHAIITAGTVVLAAVFVERYFHHPTYGDGLRAAYAVARAALVIG